MPPMPMDIFPFVFGVMAVALAASVVEFKAATRAPVCPRCIHCKHAALERRAAEQREHNALSKRLWGVRDDDLDDPNQRP